MQVFDSFLCDLTRWLCFLSEISFQDYCTYMSLFYAFLLVCSDLCLVNKVNFPRLKSSCSLSHKEPQKRRPTQCNQDVHTDVSFQNKCTEIPTNSRTLSHISSTVSTAAVQVRDQAINLTRRVLWTQSADVSYSIMSPISSDSKITNSSSSFDEKPKFLEA